MLDEESHKINNIDIHTEKNIKDFEVFLSDVKKNMKDVQQGILFIKKRIFYILNKIMDEDIDNQIFYQEVLSRINGDLNENVNIANSENFFNLIRKILTPFFDIIKKYPDKFEEAWANAMCETERFIRINRIIAYDRHGDCLTFHALPGRHLKRKIFFIMDGLKKIAEIVSKDKSIKFINTTSHFVAEHDSLFKKTGFLIINNQEQKLSVNKKKMDEIPIEKSAWVSRDIFIKKFL